MKLYLSSYKIGNEKQKLQELLSKTNGKVGYIPNALDFTNANPDRRREHIESDMNELREMNLAVEILDLKKYFGKMQELQKKIDELGAVWVSGGNVFVLRQAMKLSGFDEILKTLVARDDFVYGGYSAAGCVLSPTLDGYQIVDDATDLPYEGMKEVIKEGIGLIPYAFLPHFDSDHPESDDINKEVRYCTEHKIAFRTLKDGDAIIVE